MHCFISLLDTFPHFNKWLKLIFGSENFSKTNPNKLSFKTTPSCLSPLLVNNSLANICCFILKRQSVSEADILLWGENSFTFFGYFLKNKNEHWLESHFFCKGNNWQHTLLGQYLTDLHWLFWSTICSDICHWVVPSPGSKCVLWNIDFFVLVPWKHCFKSISWKTPREMKQF